MNVLILNGSPRKNGNTVHALRALKAGFEAKHAKTEWIGTVDLNLKGCVNCDSCKRNGGTCVLPDGGAEYMEKVVAADLIVFGSPVYWWGISGQLKMALDKFYSKDDAFHSMKKKLGIVAVGADALNGIQYKLISDQFKSIAEFLGWELVIDESVQAWKPDDLANDSARLAALTERAKAVI